MKCPSCQHNVDLGWIEYIKEFRNRHICPQCGKVFKLKFSITYILVLTGVCTLLVVVPALLVLRYSGNLRLSLAISTLLGLCFGLPVDRWLDDRIRLPVLVESGKEKNNFT